MSETTMPAAEAEAVVETPEVSSYELAFHVLPTVAEGEVTTVFDTIKAAITKIGAEVFDEETPERFDLAYEIVQHSAGTNRSYDSAYFGWVRFKVAAESITAITEDIESDTNILRYLLIRLTRIEEQNPFRFHEALQDQKQVSTVEESEVVPDFHTVSEEDSSKKKETVEESAEVDDAELDKALEQKEA